MLLLLLLLLGGAIDGSYHNIFPRTYGYPLSAPTRARIKRLWKKHGDAGVEKKNFIYTWVSRPALSVEFKDSCLPLAFVFRICIFCLPQYVGAHVLALSGVRCPAWDRSRVCVESGVSRSKQYRSREPRSSFLRCTIVRPRADAVAWP